MNSNKKERFFSNSINLLLLAMLCTLLWGSAFPGVKIGYKLFNIESGNIYSQILFAGVRFTLSGIVLYLIHI